MIDARRAAPKVAPLSVVGAAREPADTARAKPLVARGISKWHFLDGLRKHSAPRTAACRRRRISPTVQVQQRADGSRSVSGVLSCGSVWACPVCSQRICSHRADELQSAIRYWKTKPISMLTLTVRHGLGDNLKQIRAGLSRAWRRMLQGRRAKKWRALFHVKHNVRALEVTHGDNGFHPHLHILLFQDAEADATALDWIREEWSRAVERELGKEHAPDWTHGAVLLLAVAPRTFRRWGSK